MHTSVGEWLASQMMASMWTQKASQLVYSPGLERIPMAGWMHTMDLGRHAPNLQFLSDHHQSMGQSLSPSDIVASVITAMVSSATSPTGGSGGDDIDTVNCGRSASVALADAFETTSSSDLWQSAPSLVFSMNRDLERLIGWSPEEMAKRARTVGWRTDIVIADPNEYTQVWKHTMRAIAGVASTWHARASILTKWGGIIKCLVTHAAHLIRS